MYIACMLAKLPDSEKIFCVSFHKTGTTSFHDYLETYGIASCHGAKKLDNRDYRPDLESAKRDLEGVANVLAPFLDRYQALSDTPYNVLYRQLARKYPSAYYVLITRNLDSWWNSLQEHWSLQVLGHRLTTLEYIQYHPYISNCDKVFTRKDRDELISAHHSHIEQVKAHLVNNRFIAVELEDQDKSRKLAEFLGLDYTVTFPHNKARGVQHNLRRVWKNLRLRARSTREGALNG
jgi:hypothetical protein